MDALSPADLLVATKLAVAPDHAGTVRALGTDLGMSKSAVANALRDFAHRPIVIQADSAYTIGCATTWATGWARNGWQNSKKEIVANVEIVQGIYALMQARRDAGVPVYFQKVKAHLADLSVWPLNVAADELAGQASARAARGNVAEARTGTS